MSRTIKIKGSEIKRIVEQVLGDTNEISGVEDEFDLDTDKGGGVEGPEDDVDMSKLNGAGPKKYAIGKDEDGKHYVIDILQNKIIGIK